MAYFGYGLSVTGAVTYALRNSRIAQSTPCAIGAVIGAIGMIVGMHMVDYEKNSILKSGMFAAFCGLEALMILPLIQMSTVATIGQAALATSAMMGSLATVAIMSPSEQFLNMSGALGIGLGCLLGVSVASIFFP